MHELEAPLLEAWQDIVTYPSTLHVLAKLNLIRLLSVNLSGARPLLRVLFPASVMICRERDRRFGRVVKIEECSRVFECPIHQFGRDLVIDNAKEAIVFSG
jgi:hypothetical protein